MAKEEQKAVAAYWTKRCKELLQERNNLSRDDLEYVAEKVAGMRDERLKQSVATLIGWGDEDRAELETFAAISLEIMKTCAPSVIREAARKVEIRYLNAQQAKNLPLTAQNRETGIAS